MTYLPQVLDLVSRFYEDPQKIIAIHVPSTKDANLHLNFFISKKSESGAALAFERLKTFETQSPELFYYLEYLVSLGQPARAWDIFQLRTDNRQLSTTPASKPSRSTGALTGDSRAGSVPPLAATPRKPRMAWPAC